LCSPEGQKFRSKTQLEAYIKEHNLNVNVSDFCFSVRGQCLLGIASSNNSNGRSYKRKRDSSHEVAIDGRLENATSSDVDDSKPKQKRMRLWEPKPSSDLMEAEASSENSDCQIVSVCKMETKKDNKKINFLNSHVQSIKETIVNKDKRRLAKTAAKSSSTKARRASPKKLTVRMKFMPNLSRKEMKKPEKQSNLLKKFVVKQANVESQSASHSPISGRFCSSANSDNSDLLTLSPTVSLCKLVSKQNDSPSKKQQSIEHFAVIKQPVSPGKSPSSGRKLDLKNVVNGDESLVDVQWIPPQSPFNLVEESLFHSSWKILVASILLEKGQGWLVSVSCQPHVVDLLGFERYWYWGTGYWPILAGIGVDWVLGNIFLTVKPDTRYPYPLTPPARRCTPAATIHLDLDLLANNSGRKSGVGRGRQEVHCRTVGIYDR